MPRLLAFFAPRLASQCWLLHGGGDLGLCHNAAAAGKAQPVFAAPQMGRVLLEEAVCLPAYFLPLQPVAQEARQRQAKPIGQNRSFQGFACLWERFEWQVGCALA
jgi:hypothetical protein